MLDIDQEDADECGLNFNVENDQADPIERILGANAEETVIENDEDDEAADSNDELRPAALERRVSLVDFLCIAHALIFVVLVR